MIVEEGYQYHDGKDQDQDESWVDFEAMEVEEARSRRKDPRSYSTIFCFNQCLTGPSEKATGPKVANAINMMMIGFNILAMTYTLKGQWVWLVSLNICFGIIAQMLMWCVQFSDPGVLSRQQD